MHTAKCSTWRPADECQWVFYGWRWRGKGGLQVVQKILDSRLIPELMELNHPDEDPQAHDIKIVFRGERTLRCAA